MATSPIGLPPQPTRSATHDLVLAGEFALLADPDHPLDSVDSILRRLMEHARADAAELFLAAPGGTEVVLVSHQGRDPGAFCQQDRFQAGEGFPGLALRTGRPILSDHVDTDVHFIRSRVKALHYRSVVCVPFGTEKVVGGCLLLAWCDSDAQFSHALRQTTLAARQVGLVLEIAHARYRLRKLDQSAELRTGLPLGWRPEDSPTAGAVTIRRVFPSGGPPADPRAHGCGTRSCCAATQGRIQVFGGRSGWPKSCLEAGCVAAARYCIPLLTGEAVWGIATVAFRHGAPAPLTRFLPMALWQIEDVQVPEAMGREAGVPPIVRPSTAQLEIRCFGAFDVRSQGRLLHLADFGRQKARELLAVLVANGGRPMSGERLAETLWPDASPAQSRNRFHVTLSALRRAIEPTGVPGWTYVRRDGRGYFLDPQSPVHVDLWRFGALLRQADTLSIPVAARRVAFDEAIALYEDDPFDAQFSAACLEGLVLRWREAVRRTRERLAVSEHQEFSPCSARIH